MDSGAAEDGSEPERPLSGLSGPAVETSQKGVAVGQGGAIPTRAAQPRRFGASVPASPDHLPFRTIFGLARTLALPPNGFANTPIARPDYISAFRLPVSCRIPHSHPRSAHYEQVRKSKFSSIGRSVGETSSDPGATAPSARAGLVLSFPFSWSADIPVGLSPNRFTPGRTYNHAAATKSQET